MGYRLHEFDDAERPNEIFAHPARDQLAIEDDVVDLAEDDDFRAGVAKLRKFIELLDQRVSVCGRLENYHVRSRCASIGLHRCGGAAHILFYVSLAHTPVVDGALHDGGDFRGLAEGLNGDPRNGIDLWDRDRLRIRRGRRVLQCLSTHASASRSNCADRRRLSFPFRPRILSLANIADRPQTHFLVGRGAGPRLGEVARIIDLRGQDGLRRATEILVGAVLPSLYRAPRGQVARPLPAARRHFRSKALKNEPDGARQGRVGDGVVAHCDVTAHPARVSVRRISFTTLPLPS